MLQCTLVASNCLNLVPRGLSLGTRLSLSTIFIVPLTGAFGYFEVTHDISQYCKAKVFSHIGKRTPIAVRFSTVGESMWISVTLAITSF